MFICEMVVFKTKTTDCFVCGQTNGIYFYKFLFDEIFQRALMVGESK